MPGDLGALGTTRSRESVAIAVCANGNATDPLIVRDKLTPFMKATPFEFRFRFFILAVIYILGFAAPWNYWLHLDSIRTWQLLAAWPARSGWVSFSKSTIFGLLLGIARAPMGAFLRPWGTAYLRPSIVQDSALHGEGVIAAGPYRYIRNPLYLGNLFHTFALALLMPPSGAIICILAIGIFQLRL